VPIGRPTRLRPEAAIERLEYAEVVAGLAGPGLHAIGEPQPHPQRPADCLQLVGDAWPCWSYLTAPAAGRWITPSGIEELETCYLRRLEDARPTGISRDALRTLREGQGEVAHLGGAHPLAVAVAVGGPFVRAELMELATNGSPHPGFQQVLESPAHDLLEQGASACALHELSLFGGGTMGEGHGLCSVWW
jgi:hypothetical protein